MERKPYWYSVIQYYPNSVKGEVLNVGVIIHQPDSGSVRHFILDTGNIKLRGILSNQVNFDSYKIQKEYFEYYLEKLPNSNDLLIPNVFTHTFLLELAKEFPPDFKASEPTFALTNNLDTLFNQLLSAYIGSDFINRDDYQQITTKKYVRNYFDERKLIDRKVKPNVKFTPIKNVESMHFLIDFVYKNGVLNFMQAVPSNKDHFTNWFTKINTITNVMQDDLGFHLLYDSTDKLNEDKTVKQTLSYLQSKDQRINIIDIHTGDFEMFCRKIESDGKDVEDYESELILLQGA
ncbi:hypothetical protein BC6307_18185 [Sutcliffiella cohnii]|uniref:DUF3037 domain-containing protein n=1 Tax=Sutcliffiella cohnii TaxID=33932 RepID=A0A223KUN8_9BACI|nr:DUF3037 domain-containing protein [Sutcliffiella cohnii]AST93048.1 hypothetical protein BC6307_18185 [Sutcliffiella cohnii]